MNAFSGKLDLSRSAVPRYLQLATLFRRRVEGGTWKLGQKIPTVDELATECSVARATIRQALDTLEEEGLIERFRAKGTFVRRTPASRLWCDVEADWNGLLRSREGARIEILADTDELREASSPIASASPRRSTATSADAAGATASPSCWPTSTSIPDSHR